MMPAEGLTPLLLSLPVQLLTPVLVHKSELLTPLLMHKLSLCLGRAMEIGKILDKSTRYSFLREELMNVRSLLPSSMAGI